MPDRAAPSVCLRDETVQVERKSLDSRLSEPKTYSTAEVAAIARITLRQLQWWDEKRVISPEHQGHQRIYSAAEVIETMAIAELRRKQVSLQRIRRARQFLHRGVVRHFLEIWSGLHFYLIVGEQYFFESRPEAITKILSKSIGPMFVVKLHAPGNNENV